MKTPIRALAVILAFGALASCFPTTTGAPCASDLNCPSNQFCVAGLCVLASGSGGGSGGSGGAGGASVDGGGGGDGGVVIIGEGGGDTCTDGKDNDNDGLIDCKDPDCAAKTCRVPAGACDRAETCTNEECPADEKSPPNTLCRPAVDGGCDVAELCDGTTTECGPDVVVAANTGCRAAIGVCDVAESCSGTSPTCPLDGFQPVTQQCGNAAAGDCDLPDFCSGTSPGCDNALRPATATCRVSGGACDPEEKCSGTSPDCQANAISGTSVVCRPDAGLCDTAETCDGVRLDCPPDGFVGQGTGCRAAALGGCDKAETCPGNGPACPADGFLTGTVCRAAIPNACDVEETCAGNSAACPPDGFAAVNSVCRGSAGACDAVERCTGTATCPADVSSCGATEYCAGTACAAKKALGSACVTGAECSSTFCANGFCCNSGCSGACEQCSATGSCGFKPASAPACRSSAGDCDPAESCTGSSAACPPDVLAAASLSCRSSGGLCDLEEKCTGTSPVCPPNILLGSSSTCRGSAGLCDVAEVCSGTSAQCPADVLRAIGAVCNPAVGVCDRAEACSGTSAACPADAYEPAMTPCGLPSCVNGNFTPTPQCVGTSNTCQNFGTSGCNGFQCNAMGTACLATCTQNADCLSTHYCQGTGCVPKLADGATCANSTDCVSGSCLQGYADVDNDGYGNASAPGKFCGNLPITPVKYVANATDCCDSNQDVRPNQTTFFDVPVPGACSSRGFDYDCSGFPNHQYVVNGCSAGTCSTGSCSSTRGWSTGSYPGCGVFGTLRSCSTGSLICTNGGQIVACNAITSTPTPDRCR